MIKNIQQFIFDSLAVAYLLLIGMYFLVPAQEESSFELTRHFYKFLGFFGIGLILSFICQRMHFVTLGHLIFKKAKLNERSWYSTFWGMQSIVLFSVTFLISLFATHLSIIKILDKESFDHAMNLFSQMAHPDWSILPTAVLKIIETIFIAFMATVLAIPIAFILSFLTAKNLMSENKISIAIYFSLRLLLNLTRSIEPVLWAIVFSVWVGFGPYAGMLALFLHSIASLAKQYSEIVEGVDDGPIQAIRSTGANKMQWIWFAVVPQITLPYISFTIYRWDINVRMATIIGFVGGGGIGATLLEAQGQALWPQVGCIIVVIAFVVWVMDTFSAYVREAVK